MASFLVMKFTFSLWCRSPTELIRPRTICAQPQWRLDHVVQHLRLLSDTRSDRGNNPGRNSHTLDYFRFEHDDSTAWLRLKITAAGTLAWQEGALSGPSCFVCHRVENAPNMLVLLEKQRFRQDTAPPQETF